MTRQKHLKQLVRARMQRTGESYAAARRQMIARAAGPSDSAPAQRHFPGSVPAATALRVLLAHAGVRAPHTGAPFSEAMVFGLAGGIGAGVFSFLYEKDDFASFWIAGRHLWQDDVAYLTAAARRFHTEPEVREAGGAKQAASDLRAALEAAGVAIVWVDLTLLPHRGMPESMSGGGYHVVTAYEIDDHAGRVLIGDLTDEPIALPLDTMAAARARIKKQRNRVMTLRPAGSAVDLRAAVRDALRACRSGLLEQRMRNFTLESFRDWAARLDGSGKGSWETVFSHPARFWTGLRYVHDCIEHYGTGGGLSRPLFADFLEESGAALGDGRLADLAARYRSLGDDWTALAEAALPAGVPELARTRVLLARKAELVHSGGDGAASGAQAIWAELEDVGARVRASFSLSESGAKELRRDLAARVQSLYEGERRALSELEAWIE